MSQSIHSTSNPGCGSGMLSIHKPLATTIRMLAFALIAAACGNAILYSHAGATPLVQADAWYFLDAFLSRYFDGSLSFFDLFIQREAGDHSQPLHKLILLFHTRYFGMDFGIEGLIGTAIGILWCCAIAVEMRRQPDGTPLQAAMSWLCIGLVFALGLSINSSNIFTWPLVTLGYIPLLLATLYFSLSMTQLERNRPLWVLLATALLGACIDEVALVVVVAATLACIPLRGSNIRQKVWIIGSAFAGLLIARVFLAWLSYRAGVPAGSGTSPQSLSAVFLNTEALRGLLIPFSDSLFHAEHLQRWYPDSASSMLILCATAVAALHLYFWISVLLAWRNARYTRTHAMATFLMLVAYALTAGIIVSRVPLFDWNYLHQPRYVMYYQLGLVAIAILFQQKLCQPTDGKSPIRLWFERVVVIVVIALLLTAQQAAARSSWGLPYYLSAYWQNAALSMQKLAANPLDEPGSCPDLMSICEYPAEQRARLMGLLVEKQLNIFSPAFQMRHRLYPSLASIPGFSPGQSQTQQFDQRIRESSAPAVLSVQSTEASCNVADGTRQVQIQLDTGELAPFGAHVWIESIGASRTLLAATPSGQSSASLEYSIPSNASTLTLVRADNQVTLAQRQIELPACQTAP